MEKTLCGETMKNMRSVLPAKIGWSYFDREDGSEETPDLELKVEELEELYDRIRGPLVLNFHSHRRRYSQRREDWCSWPLRKKTDLCFG